MDKHVPTEASFYLPKKKDTAEVCRERIKELDKVIEGFVGETELFNVPAGEKEELLKKRNALYSQRKYYRKKLLIAEFQSEIDNWHTKNAKLRAENEILEKMLDSAKQNIFLQQFIEGQKELEAIRALGLSSHHSIAAGGLRGVAQSPLELSDSSLQGLQDEITLIRATKQALLRQMANRQEESVARASLHQSRLDELFGFRQIPSGDIVSSALQGTVQDNLSLGATGSPRAHPTARSSLEDALQRQRYSQDFLPTDLSTMMWNSERATTTHGNIGVLERMLMQQATGAASIQGQCEAGAAQPSTSPSMATLQSFRQNHNFGSSFSPSRDSGDPNQTREALYLAKLLYGDKGTQTGR